MNPLALSAQAVADASGDITVTLPAPSLGTWWQAAVVVPTAPTGATLALYLAGGKELSWIGPQPSAAIVVLPGQVMKVEGAGFTAFQAVSVNVRGGWASGNAQGIPPAGPSSFTANTLTGKVTAKITGPVTIASGTVDLAAGSSVAINAGQLSSTTIPLQAVATQMLVTTFGTGETGTVTISAPATLTGVANYQTLTVDAALTSPWEVFCSVEATGTGSISNSGGTGSKTSSTGHGGLAGTFLGGGSPASKNAPAADFTGGPGGTGKTGTTLEPGGTAGNPVRGTILYGTLQHYTFSGGGAGGGVTTGTTPYYYRGGGAGVVMVAAKKLTGSFTIAAKGGNGVKTGSSWGGAGGGGIALLYSHTAKTWTGAVTVKPGTVTTESSGSGGGGSKIVRKKYVGALFT